MAKGMDDEDYWNRSDLKAFNFEDEHSGSQIWGVSKSETAHLSQQVRAEIGQGGSGFTTDSLSGQLSKIGSFDCKKDEEVPLLTLISQKSLNCILDATVLRKFEVKECVTPEEECRILRRMIEDRWNPPPVEQTLYKVLLGHPFSLELYRSLSSKKELLDAAIKLGDGNAILAVVLFLVRTLKKSTVYQILSSRNQAVTQYAQYLINRMQLQELTDLLDMVQQRKEASIKQFQFAAHSASKQRKLQLLQSCLINHFQDDDTARKWIVNFIKLLQLTGSDTSTMSCQSPIQLLAHSCEKYWTSSKDNSMSPQSICHNFGIDEKFYHWTALNIRASIQAWDDVDSILTKKSLYGKTMKRDIPIEPAMLKLREMGASTSFIDRYLGTIDNLEKRLKLAQKLQCHKAIIDIYVHQRDKQSLISYQATLDPQTDSYIYAENALKSKTNKWRN